MLQRGNRHLLTRLAVPLLGVVLLACAGGSPAGEAGGMPKEADQDSVRMTLTVTNGSDDPVGLRFPSAQRYDFVIRESGDRTVRWRWSEGRMFAQVTGEEVVPPGDSVRYEATFDEGLEPGLYTVVGVVASSNRPTGARVTVRGLE